MRTRSRFNSLESFSGKRNREKRGRWGQMDGVFLRIPDFMACLCAAGSGLL